MFAASLGVTPVFTDVEDVFATALYTGNGSTQTVTNTLDLSGKGGLVWIKRRNGTEDHFLFDTTRGVNVEVNSNTTNANVTLANSLTAFNSDGFSLSSATGVNTNTGTYVSWSFIESSRFFDVVSYVGNGVNGRFISHNLGVTPGLIIIKRTDVAESWAVWHRSLTDASPSYANNLFLNTTDAASNQQCFRPAAEQTNTTFAITNSGIVNQNTGTYIAYLLAHDASANGVIQCGSFTTDGGGNGTFDPGWSQGVQFVLLKASSTTGDWEIYDTQRTPAWSSLDSRLRPNLINAESTVIRLSASGTALNFTNLTASQTYVCCVIAAP